ncbi:hypothetical protein O9H85_21135 [Paenibacillus filicis]|uniref:Uncharacterized protein n=1 Tax=Paenibacillus gyeongsangnamensis TaxID=3388067 RepID=A0ABT4QDC6_9BACL|nr:hypothetical protein [Paenibacillus filicis]MCZ8514878.1 hypothetical protein [Paenibacillus filicis]
MQEGYEAFQEMVHRICYAFYRYEIQSGLSLMEPMTKQFTELLENHDYSEKQLQDMNKLLELILLAVEKKDFLIAADLLKHELCVRIMHPSSFPA